MDLLQRDTRKRNFGQNRVGYVKSGFSAYKSSYIYETGQDRDNVAIEDQ